jgi:hypothetical protein
MNRAICEAIRKKAVIQFKYGDGEVRIVEPQCHGISTTGSNRHARIATGSGYIIAPKIKLVSLNTCGKTFRRSTMIGHTLPFGNIVDGLLGMDILFRLNAKILVATGWIDVA